MNAPLVSVCCLGYNHARFAEEAIESLFQQTYHNLEIIVIDDGSTDRTYEIAEAMRARSPFPMQVITQSNTGKPGVNLNRAVSLANGKYVRFLSLDDLFNLESTDEFTRIIEQDPECQFVCSDRTPCIDDESQLTGTSCETPFVGKSTTEVTLDDLLQYENLEGGTFFIQNAIFRKTAIDACGGFDEELIGDDITLRVRLFQYMQFSGKTHFTIINHPAFIYRIHANNLHKNADRQIDTLAQVNKKYFPGQPGKVIFHWLRHATHVRLLELQKSLDKEFVHQNDPKRRDVLEASLKSLRCTIWHSYLGFSQEESAWTDWDSVIRSTQMMIDELQRTLDQPVIHQNDQERRADLESAIQSLRSSLWQNYLRLPPAPSIPLDKNAVTHTAELKLIELKDCFDQASIHLNDAAKRQNIDAIMMSIKSMLWRNCLDLPSEPLDKESVIRLASIQIAELHKTLDQVSVHQNDRDKLKELETLGDSLRSAVLQQYLGMPKEQSLLAVWYAVIKVSVRRCLRSSGVLETARWLAGRNPDGTRKLPGH